MSLVHYPAMDRTAPAPLDEMMARLERALAASPADSTEILWIESRRAQATAGRGRREAEADTAGPGGRGAFVRSLLVNVRQSGRTGLHRTGGAEPSDLETALRQALAQARLAPPTAAEPLAGAGERADESADGAARGDALYDPELAELEAGRARSLLERAAERGEVLRLAWLEGQVAIANSAGLRRAARVTAANFTARCGRGPGAGSAAGASRRLDGLYLQDTLDLARARRAGADGDGDADGGAGPAAAVTSAAPAAPAPEATEPPASQAPKTPASAAMVLSEQGAAALFGLLNRHALSGAAPGDTGSGRRRGLGDLGARVMASCLSLRDDGTDPRALPFPFDLGGWPKRPVDLIVDGVFATPAVDARLAREIGRPPTPHALAPDEILATNLLLLPGDRAPLPEAELLRLAEDGIWIGALVGVECFDPGSLRFRARAREVRRIAAGALGPPLPDFIWEDDLLAVLARAAALGDRPATIAAGDMLFGATAAPLLALHLA